MTKCCNGAEECECEYMAWYKRSRLTRPGGLPEFGPLIHSEALISLFDSEWGERQMHYVLFAGLHHHGKDF